MTDTIYRKDAIEAIRKAYFDKDIQSAKDDPCIVDAMTDWAIRQIKALPSAEAVQGWIPCSERLPNENGEYIASLEDSVYPWARFFNGKWFMLSINAIAREFGEYEVIAWMPLPKPYKGGEDE